MAPQVLTVLDRHIITGLIQGSYRDYIWIIKQLYRDNGKEHGNYWDKGG